MIRRGAAAVLAVALGPLGCPHPGGETDPPPGTSDAVDDDPPPRADAGASEPTACGEAHSELGETAFVPASARAAILLDLDAPDIDAAVSRLAEHARGTDHGLPIDLAFAMSQWTWQVAALRASLASVGLEPAQLLYLRTDEASGAWLLGHGCDLDELRTRTTEHWGLTWRTHVEGAVGRAPETFAFDVLALPGDRLAFVARGRGDAWLPKLHADPKGHPLHEALAPVGPAAIRGLMTGRAFVDPGAGDVDPDQVLTATAAAVHVGALGPDVP